MKDKRFKSKLICVLILVAMALVISGCSSSDSEEIAAVDYSQSAHWLNVPEENDKPVDVFYLYPTAWAKENEDDPNICEIDNESMLAGAKKIYSTQATAFETTANIYAPYYRQADAPYLLAMEPEDHMAILDDIPKTDVFAALDYYFENYNEGRPFILAGHSQGSNVLLFVLSEYMEEHPELYERMVAAYVIGFSVTEEFMEENPHLKFAQEAGDTGVIISYNTEAPGMTIENPVVWEGALSINPISWTTDETTAEASQSLGSYIDGQKVEHFADATIDKERNTLICSTADPDEFYTGNPVFPRGLYHGRDYDFYYYDIRANAELRVKNFLENMQ
ncbi:MAG: DUF3089 domain-containing protein [Anaerovoracaceae bacterium]|nr:DUF3089 domain-containing protein [Anaerovoracaceae bacterium]